MDTNAHGFLGARASARFDVAVPDGSNSPGTTLDADIEAPSPLRSIHTSTVSTAS